ncbi:hypothetical protein [Salinibacter ruber]|uniref:hypothetical protein n=1 Tax=Salinibacter ruber TaxID=146919 RepID=UPI002169E293|nr:hypothetical protein [Salinibacter ruber]
MSVFHIYKGDDFVSVTSDTSHIFANEGEEVMQAKKTTFLPSNNLILASSGHTAFFLKYYQAVHLMVNQSDPYRVNEIAPELMRQAWQAFHREEDVIQPDHTPGGTMLYQLGYSPGKDEFCGWRYYSGDEFEPEEMPTEWVQPVRQEALESMETNQELRERAAAVFRATKEVEEKKPKEERVAIGGTVWMHTMKRDAYGAERLHVFE